MEFGRILKDVILITPYSICLLLFIVMSISVYLILFFTGSMIFIYEEIKNVKKTN